MIAVPSPLPVTFRCEINEEITIDFAPTPDDSLDIISFCVDTPCPEPKHVQNNQLKIRVDKEFTLRVFCFFRPGLPLGKCDITFSGKTGNSFQDSRPIRQDTTTGGMSDRRYVFEIIS
jgi:hypothetical protein